MSRSDTKQAPAQQNSATRRALLEVEIQRYLSLLQEHYVCSALAGASFCKG
jgi:hypothetical protein